MINGWAKPMNHLAILMAFPAQYHSTYHAKVIDL
jgi:hypothetical protein